MPLKGKNRLLRKYNERSDKFVRALGLTTTVTVADKTPVDTARAANNWNLATGAPDTTNLPEGEYPKNASIAILNAQREAGKLKAGDTIFVTNALPYIPALEDGHSQQAPAGMIGLTVRELVPWADAEVRKIRNGD